MLNTKSELRMNGDALIKVDIKRTRRLLYDNAGNIFSIRTALRVRKYEITDEGSPPHARLMRCVKISATLKMATNRSGNKFENVYLY